MKHSEVSYKNTEVERAIGVLADNLTVFRSGIEDFYFEATQNERSVLRDNTIGVGVGDFGIRYCAEDFRTKTITFLKTVIV